MTSYIWRSTVKRAVSWLARTPALGGVRKHIEKILGYYLAEQDKVIENYGQHERAKVFRWIRNFRRQVKITMTDAEAHWLYMAARRTRRIPGDIAELGVYRGGSALIICSARLHDRPLHLFDTFTGLPPVGPYDSLFFEGKFSRVALADVKDRFKDYSQVFFYPGFFPDTAAAVVDKKFSLVHLDADLYQSTLDGLKFFYPRMNRGGIILTHDYIQAEGVYKAFDDFLRDKPEMLLEARGNQGFIIKL